MSKRNKNKNTRQVYQVPSNAELDAIKLNPILSETVKEDMITLHKINKGLKSMVMDAVKQCMSSMLDNPNNRAAHVVKIDVMTPHVVYPGDTEYITSEVSAMIEDWWDEPIDVEITELSQAFIICLYITYDDTGDPYGHFVSIHAVPSSMENPAWSKSILTLSIG